MASLQVIHVSDAGTRASKPISLSRPKDATKAQIQSFINKARKHKDYYYRIPTDSQLEGKRWTNHVPSVRFPRPADFAHRVLIEAQSPLFTTNEDGEYSSRGLTDWYVKTYCALNKLKEC